MSQPTLNALIISNLKDLDAAAFHLENTLYVEVGAALDSASERLCGAAGWDCLSDWNDDHIWVAPKDWRTSDGGPGDDYKCKFSLTHESDQLGDLDYFWLTQLVGQGHSRLGFRWSRQDVTKARWKRAVAENTALIEAARKLGFSYAEKDGSFFLPVVIDVNRLAEAMAEESPEQALQPFEEAFNKLVQAKPVFDKLRDLPVD